MQSFLSFSQSEMAVNAFFFCILRSLHYPLAEWFILWPYYGFSLYSNVSFLLFKMGRGSSDSFSCTSFSAGEGLLYLLAYFTGNSPIAKTEV